jgi:hypothetical protein
MGAERPSLTAGTLIDGALSYAAAADAVNDRLPNAVHVLSHLLGMSIELALKAYLRHHGSPANELIALGHDLAALYERALQFGLTDTGSRSFRFGLLGADYKAQLFGYPEEGQMELIAPWSLREIAHGLLTEVFAKIRGQRMLAELAYHPGLRIASRYPRDFDASAWAMPFPASR